MGSRHPGEPFPLDEAWLWEDDETVDAVDSRIDAVFTHGSVVLGTEDGPSFLLLVTAGSRRGEIWMVSEVGAAPAPATDARDFNGWVRHWKSGNDCLAGG
ncbi:hypothetical protein GCM10010495_49050 [Kitasatospora herbaricolor]|uniref:hypothetical protein n=1 Tax=Kitasatospora herbaricolor TaxID=68217 RepID=UPI00174C391D|nr:hypothetical protein [Kitasatospora herbaricolor]MDQ0305728.1 hypothetical protein [Kitasatospora herbaricolor]GGV27152.1 hypothetical protein GCM10010495_49050 [Kitasatospora herbaricolor]